MRREVPPGGYRSHLSEVSNYTSFCLVAILKTSAKVFELNHPFSYFLHVIYHITLNFLHNQLSPLVAQLTPLLAEISMSFCFKLLHFFIFLLWSVFTNSFRQQAGPNFCYPG